jgi:hypothetical protein
MVFHDNQYLVFLLVVTLHFTYILGGWYLDLSYHDIMGMSSYFLSSMEDRS